MSESSNPIGLLQPGAALLPADMAAALRILVLTPDFPPAYGGIQLLIHRLVKFCRFDDVLVVTFTTQGAHEFDREEPYRIRRVRTASVFGRPFNVARLNARAMLDGRRFRPDAVLSGHIVTSLGAHAISRFTGAPIVQYLHAQEVVERPRLARFAIRCATAVIAVSRHTASLALAHGARREDVYCIPNGVDLPAFRRAERSERPLILTVSRLRDRYKGHDVLIDAMPRILARVPQTHWVVLGDGPLRPFYQRLVRRRGLSRRVSFLGSVTDAERDAWLDRAHVFAMPSRLPREGGGEGFGIAFLEAAAHGTPVVAGNVGGALDAVVDGETGFLVDPTDDGALAAAVTTLLLDPDRARAMGAAAADRARRFAWPAIADRVAGLLHQVVAATR